ncbi:MAG TPA: peptidase MA family metallohydrolase [Anaerolineales bacterium]|nr:peptidase MA family metallohydrolase [Anaerolineales bacterium]
MRRRQLLLTLILSLSLFAVPTVSAAPLAEVSGDQPILDFPNTITFQARISANANITSVVLEYGTEQQTCGDVIAKAFPEFSPAKSVDVEWTWDMRQSGSLPPGATIWWRWRYTDEAGKESISNQKTITWLDSVHNWQTITSGELNLHWYEKDKAFAQEMLNAGTEGLGRNDKQAGLKTDSPIDLYVYPNYDDLREAILFESSWVGGQAFPDENIVIMGTSGSDSNWDQNTVIHELTHVLVGHLTFSCLSYVPQWLNEGLAVYSEGPLDPQFQGPLDQAIQNDNLLTIRSISGAFSEVASKADLSYAQSYSVVNFLIETYGQDKMTALLVALRDGATTDDALTQTYGFNIDGLETEWRKSISAQPETVSAQPTVQPTPTYVPTIIPVSGAPLVIQITATAIPTSSVSEQPTTQPGTGGGPPLALTLCLIGFCCILLVLIGVVVLGFIVRRQNRNGGNNVAQ